MAKLSKKKKRLFVALILVIVGIGGMIFSNTYHWKDGSIPCRACVVETYQKNYRYPTKCVGVIYVCNGVVYHSSVVVKTDAEYRKYSSMIGDSIDIEVSRNTPTIFRMAAHQE